MEPVRIGESVVRNERGAIIHLQRDTPWPDEIIVTPALLREAAPGGWLRHDMRVTNLTARAVGPYPCAEYDVLGMTEDGQFLHCRRKGAA